jgi:predicted YcjX-like family ATPase
MCGTAATVVSSFSLAIFPSSQPKKTPIYSFEFDKSRNLQKLQKLQLELDENVPRIRSDTISSAVLQLENLKIFRGL